jgi:hypothetical protein
MKGHASKMAFDVSQPFILKYPGSGNQTLQNPDGTAYDPDADAEDLEGSNGNQMIIVTPQSGPPTLVKPDGTAVDLNAAVLMPYSQTISPGVIVVG